MGFRKNIIESEVKNLSSLDVGLILCMDFDILENCNRSGLGKETVAKIFNE